MNEIFPKEAQDIMNERFGCDSLIAFFTIDGDMPSVRAVNSYYEDGAFYVITYALSNKMQQIAKNPKVAICGDWFTAHGIGENLGHILDNKTKKLLIKCEWHLQNGMAMVIQMKKTQILVYCVFILQMECLCHMGQGTI